MMAYEEFQVLMMAYDKHHGAIITIVVQSRSCHALDRNLRAFEDVRVI